MFIVCWTAWESRGCAQGSSSHPPCFTPESRKKTRLPPNIPEMTCKSVYAHLETEECSRMHQAQRVTSACLPQPAPMKPTRLSSVKPTMMRHQLFQPTYLCIKGNLPCADAGISGGQALLRAFIYGRCALGQQRPKGRLHGTSQFCRSASSHVPVQMTAPYACACFFL